MYAASAVADAAAPADAAATAVQALRSFADLAKSAFIRPSQYSGDSPHCSHMVTMVSSSGLAYPLRQFVGVVCPALWSAFAAALSVVIPLCAIHFVRSSFALGMSPPVDKSRMLEV